MSLTVYFQKRFIVGFDNVYLEIVSFGAFRVISSSAAFIGTRYSNAYHIAAYQTKTCVLATAINVVKSFDFSCTRLIVALRMKDKTRYMNELSHSSLVFISLNLET